MCSGFLGVLYHQLKSYQKKAGRQILASSVSPLLFLVAFGWGFGRDVSVEGVSYTVFLIPGLIAMSSLNQSYGISQEINIQRFYFHTFDEYLLAPVSQAGVVLGGAFYGMLKGFFSAAVIICFSFLFGFGVQLSLAFLAALCIHTFLFSVLGIAMSMIVEDHASQASVTTFVITPMIFLSGTFFPVDQLPLPFRALVTVLPLSHSVGAIRASLSGAGAAPVHLMVMAFYAVVLYVLALWAVKRVEG
ncbi:MAG: ABC transporter permease [Thermodesulfovibrionales bacterium]